LISCVRAIKSVLEVGMILALTLSTI